MSTPTTLVADRYRLVKLLGAGGMGVVWQAWDERLQRPVALKMLRSQPELSDQEREVVTSRAMREARITAGLHHPHAVTVFDVVEHDGQPCLVMQLIESTPLSVLLREHGTLTPRETARIGAQVSSALAAAHKMRIVHRDVKPGNILITEDGSAMISDFGISHALGDTTITATGMIHGTPAYLAPEVARGQESSFASDVFSLGSTMYAMLEGTPPFGAENNAIALLHKVARGEHPPPKHAGPLKPLLRDMLSADPKRRPDMKSIASRLSALHEGAVAGGATAPIELPTVPLGGPAAVVAVGGLPVDNPGARPADMEADADHPDETTPATEKLDEATAPTERIPEPAPAGTDYLHELFAEDTKDTDDAENTEDAEPAEHTADTEQREPTAATVPVLATNRYEPPRLASRTAETERLARAAAHPVAAWPAPKPTPRPLGRRAGVLVGILLLIGVIALATVLFSPLRQDAGNAGGPGAGEAPNIRETSAAQTPTPQETASAQTAPAESPTEETPAPPVVPNPAPAPEEQEQEPQPQTSEQRLVGTITTYYGLVPDDLDTAWPMMTTDYQVNHVGGRAAYESFWGEVADLAIADVTASAPDRAQATLTYTFTDGRVVREVTAYRLAEEGGQLKIAATTVLSSVEL